MFQTFKLLVQDVATSFPSMDIHHTRAVEAPKGHFHRTTELGELVVPPRITKILLNRSLLRKVKLEESDFDALCDT